MATNLPAMPDAHTLLRGAMEGDRRALARLISIVEEGRSGVDDILAEIFPDTGTAYVVGLTGPPGAGKSTLTDHLISLIRAESHEVAVLAVDPSSPFSGGAILGDRIRMQAHVSDPGVYVRSMSSRGHLGGVSAATSRVLALLDAVGKPFVLIETVGVGQAEVEIVESADTTIVVLNPGWGDSIQANKAGLLEIGDIFVINKADRPGTDQTVSDLRQMLMMGPDRPWTPPILLTVGTTGDGVAEVWKAILQHRGYLTESGELDVRRQARLERELRRAVIGELTRRAELAAGDDGYAEALASVRARKSDPWTAARRLLG